jgi:hypothetical protein
MIPKSYNLLGYTIHTKIVPEVEWNNKDCVGTYEPHRHRILIRDGLSAALTQHTCYHEMVHSILSAMGHPLNEDENFVDMFSGLLHQALSSAKFQDGRVAKKPKK